MLVVILGLLVGGCETDEDEPGGPISGFKKDIAGADVAVVDTGIDGALEDTEVVEELVDDTDDIDETVDSVETVEVCTPSCDEKVCGADGCGGSCGSCAPGFDCEDGACVEYTGSCPVATIKIQEGEEVCPQTKLHLIGSQSFASQGSIAQYEWSVEQPPGSQSVFLPSAAAPDPTFEANVAGSYVFTLTVRDDQGVESCSAAESVLSVVPCNAVHLELLWDTPGDSDQTDEGPEAGADLDLHFTHPSATGPDVDEDGSPDPWFDASYDCFWFNPLPDQWGPSPGGQNPTLDRDDTDGAGPENINLQAPEDGLTYRIGVHYWGDHGFGPSDATVRVYLWGQLVFEHTLELISRDMWYVADLEFPSGQVKAKVGADGGPLVAPGYENPLFRRY